MKPWLLPALSIALAVPAIAEAQVRSDTSMTRRDTVVTETQTQTTVRTDTVYRGSGVSDTSVRTTPAYSPPVYSTGSTTSTTNAYTYQEDDDHDQRAGFAFKGGLSWGDVSNRGVLPGTLRGRNGIALGLAMFGGSPVGFGVEGLYVQRGVDTEVLVTTDERHLDYIDVPAYLRMSVPFALQPFVYAGPQASFEIRCRSGSAACPDTDRPTTSWSAVIGGGLRFNPGFALSVEGRYVYGLTDLHLSTVTTTSSYRTRSFMLLAGIGL
jgi:hypothetical protein